MSKVISEKRKKGENIELFKQKKQEEESMLARIEELLGAEAEALLAYQAQGVPKIALHVPGPDYVDQNFALSDRPVRVLTNLQRLLDHGRLGGTGYISILPVDQGIEHSAGASFAPNPVCFDPEGIITLAEECQRLL